MQFFNALPNPIPLYISIQNSNEVYELLHNIHALGTHIGNHTDSKKNCLLHFAHYPILPLLVVRRHEKIGALKRLGLMVPCVPSIPVQHQSSTQAGLELQMSHGPLLYSLSGQIGQIHTVHVHHSHALKEFHT
jgi:hypothetical protein